MGDIISEFVSMTEGIASPEVFRLWAGISLVAGTLERRVWLTTGRGLSFPSLYVFLIATPGVGKKIIDEVKGLWEDVVEPGTKIKALHVAPDSMTRASFIDALAASKGQKLPPQGLPYTHHSMVIPQEEWSVLFPAYDPTFLSILTGLWSNKFSHKETRRTGKVTESKIDNPTINILAGYQPALMSVTFPEEAWASGFTRRLMLIYAGTREHKDLFHTAPDIKNARTNLLSQLSHLSGLYGEYQWTAPAVERIRSWDKGGGRPIPNHPKLEHYNQSRTEMVLRLSMTSAASRGEFRNLGLEDIDRAIGWITDAEHEMPNIFQSMSGKNDIQVLDELHYWLTREYALRKNVPLTTEEVIRFIAQRATTDKISKIFTAAEGAGYMNRVAGTDGANALWVPKARDLYGGRMQ